MVGIKGLDVRDVLVALWKGSHSQGLSILGQYAPTLSREDAEKEIEMTKGNLDYVNGRVIKCILPFGATEFKEMLYDRDNYPGAAQDVINKLREEMNKNENKN